MHPTDMKRTLLAVVAGFLFVGCGSAQVQSVAVESGKPAQTLEVDAGSAAEQAVDMGVNLQEATEILQFRAQVEAAMGDLRNVFGERLKYAVFAPQTPEYTIHVTQIEAGDAEWLDELSATGLGGTVRIEADPEVEIPSGPCLSYANEVVGTGVEIIATNGVNSVIPAFGWDEIGYCPGHPKSGTIGMTGDGFYLTIDEATLEVAPGTEFAVVVSGLLSPRFEASLEIARVTEIEPGTLQWDLTAPTTLGARDVNIGVYWAEGQSHHRIRLVVTEP